MKRRVRRLIGTGFVPFFGVFGVIVLFAEA
jgi:hypothetical protein